jgi:hypothetical protein
MTDVNSSMDIDPDGPGDFFYGFSNLRLFKFPESLRITSELQAAIATADEDPTLDGFGKASVWAGLCLWAVQELETEMVALRKELSSGQAS